MEYDRVFIVFYYIFAIELTINDVNMDIISTFNVQELASAFIVLFAVIDIIGSIPIILDLKQKGRKVNAIKATLISFALLIGFFYAGDMVLKLFQVDIASFAVAGSIVLFLLALEMILDVEIFKNQGPIKEATLVPLVFPLLAGAGSFTTFFYLRFSYSSCSSIVIVANGRANMRCKPISSPDTTL